MKKTWDEFRETGLLWFINSILHVFGWAIVVEIENKKVIDAYPMRVRFRGFDEENNSKGYEKVTHYLSENINDLVKDLED
jgi:hypothetical protein|nr:MAG TPA_asm: hypothetical protein [Caudoviricetes sp.]